MPTGTGIEEPIIDLRDDQVPKLPAIQWWREDDDEYGYTTEGYYRDGKFPSAPGC